MHDLGHIQCEHSLRRFLMLRAPCFLLGKPEPGRLQSFYFISELSVNGSNGIDTDVS